jgi:hypothetical protein
MRLIPLLCFTVWLAAARIITATKERCLALEDTCIEPGAYITRAVHRAYYNDSDIWNNDVDRNINITLLPPACELWINIVTNDATGKEVRVVV